MYCNHVAFFFFCNIGPSVSSGKTISIIHCSDSEDKAFQEEVLKLYNRFGRSLGYRCHLDKLELIQIAENKYRYAVKSVQQSDFLFICVSPELKRIFDSPSEEISDRLEGLFGVVISNYLGRISLKVQAINNDLDKCKHIEAKTNDRRVRCFSNILAPL